MTRKKKDYRQLKMGSICDYEYKFTPMIRLQGQWLDELKFSIGEPILVKCEEGKLILTVDHERLVAEEKEQAFIDEEMKKLKKKFEAEKKKTVSADCCGEGSEVLRMQGKIIMIGSMKGGVSKTVTTHNLAYSLCKLGKKVLAVDFDSQANLTTCFGVEDVATVHVTIGHLMLNQIEDEDMPEPREYIINRNGVDFIPSSMVLSTVDSKLRLEMGAEKMLSYILEPLRNSYDYILIDTSPSLGALTINALAAADEVIITVNPQLLAMMGLQDFLKTVKKIKSRVNERLSIVGILLVMCDTRTNICKTITEQVNETFEGQIKIYDSMIPNKVKVGEAVYYAEPLLEYAPDCKACEAYIELAKEVVADEE